MDAPVWITRWIPAIATIVMIGTAWGSIGARLDQLEPLRGMPLQLSEYRSEMRERIATLNAELSQRLSTVEQRSQRNYENITQLWGVARANQGKIANLLI